MNTRLDKSIERVRYERIRVAVIRGPDSGFTLDAAGRTLVVGTAETCDVRLADDTVSRLHCEIELSEAGFRVRDLASTNGIRVGRLQVFDFTTNAPVELSLGQTTLSVTPLSQTEDRERAMTDRFGDLLGTSPKMRELFAELDKLAKSNLSVLIEGETGTGKDVAAESLHRMSDRANGPFVVFDCSAVAPTLAESELFGHVRGAFTGAVVTRAGVFEEADGGTLFLDELGELPKELQPKLLRVLEKREIKRLGDRTMKPVDVRVLAATNRNLASEVRAGTFREDLFYRIAAEHVVMPPLRERKEDIPLLVKHFMRRSAPGLKYEDIPQALWEMLQSHRWPGNVRELHNAVQRLVVAPDRALRNVLGPAGSVEESAPKAELTEPVEAEPAAIEPLREARSNAVDAFELSYLKRLLGRTQGNVQRAAAIAEVSRTAIQKLMNKHDIKSRE